MNGAIAKSVKRSLCKREVPRSKLCGSIFTIKDLKETKRI